MESTTTNNKFQIKNKKFLKNMVDSASPGQLIVLLYDGAIQWLQMAKQEIIKNKEINPPNWTNLSYYARMTAEILSHLQESLNHKQDEEFADRMFSLYDFMKGELVKANVKKDAKILEPVIDILRDLKSTWNEALKKSSSEL